MPGDELPVVVDPKSCASVELGTRRELGVSLDDEHAYVVVLVTVLLAYAVCVWRRARSRA